MNTPQWLAAKSDAQLRSMCVLEARKLRWNVDDLHERMVDWGYGDSLRALPRLKLFVVLDLLRKAGAPRRPASFDYDEQGRAIYAMVRKAGLTDTRLRKLLISKFHATHINCLNDNERRQLIAIVKKIATTNETKQEETQNGNG